MFVPSILDIEASGFGSQSYPIELGVVTQEGERYCCLVKPHKDWSHWDDSAELLHGISRELLHSNGKDIRNICLEFNSLLAGTRVYSDAWAHDSPWLRTLYAYAGLDCNFSLSPIESIASEAQLQCWDEIKTRVVQKRGLTERHRATQDALVIQQTYMETAVLVQGQKSI